ncbi:MAG: hypothetical protein LGB68_04655 [Sulfurovum sp.]|nr:hypothetical protein [Sulfurovum sp.]
MCNNTRIDIKSIMLIIANLRHIEFLLGIFDNSPHNPTLGEIRQQFEEKFETLPPLLNQWFGIYRLTPLILIKAVKEHTITKEISGDLEFVRNAVAHGRFSIEEEGYIFSEKKDTKNIHMKKLFDL